MKVKTTDLQVGDVILFADMRDKVKHVGDVQKDVTVVRIEVERTLPDDSTIDTIMWAGIEAEHEVERNA